MQLSDWVHLETDLQGVHVHVLIY